MAYFDSFSNQEKELLFSLPYRTGLWISQSDTTGGDDSEAAEKQALESILTGFSQDFCKSEIAEEALQGTLANKDHWDRWAAQAESFLDDCAQAVKLMSLNGTAMEVHEYKHNLVDIATTIAMAYNEMDSDSMPFSTKLSTYGRYYWRLFVAKIRKKQPPQWNELNISQAENKALQTLAKTLGYNAADEEALRNAKRAATA